MSKYHFEEEENFGQTVRIDHINEQIKNFEKDIEKKMNPQEEMFCHFEQQTKEKMNLHIEDSLDEALPRSVSSNPEMSPKSSVLYSEEKKGDKPKQPSAGKKKKSHKITIFSLSVGAVVFSLFFFFVFQSTQVGSVKSANGQTSTPSFVPEDSEKTVDLFALVKNANTSNELSLYDVKEKKNFYIKTDSQTKLIGRNQTKMVYSDIQVGDMIRITTDQEQKKAIKIIYCEDCLYKVGVNNMKVDPIRKTIVIGGDTYSYSDETIVKYNEKLMKAEDIDPIDFVTINGYGKEIWSIMIENYHGYIVVKNKDKIINATIAIDGMNPVSLQEKDSIAVGSGAHSIVIKGDNIEPYTADIYVTENERFVIDLANMQAKTGVVVMNVNVSDYQLFVNGEPVEDPSVPLVLNQGEYELKISKEGYLDWTEKIVLKEPSMNVTIELIEEIKKKELMISTTPTGATVYLDDQLLGISPLTAQIPYGEHRFTFKMSGYYDLSVPLSIDAHTLPLSVTLNKIGEEEIN